MLASVKAEALVLEAQELEPILLALGFQQLMQVSSQVFPWLSVLRQGHLLPLVWPFGASRPSFFAWLRHHSCNRTQPAPLPSEKASCRSFLARLHLRLLMVSHVSLAFVLSKLDSIALELLAGSGPKGME